MSERPLLTFQRWLAALAVLVLASMVACERADRRGWFERYDPPAIGGATAPPGGFEAR